MTGPYKTADDFMDAIQALDACRDHVRGTEWATMERAAAEDAYDDALGYVQDTLGKALRDAGFDPDVVRLYL